MSPDGRLARATVGMGIGTTLSRLTGVLRLVALGYALHVSSLADAYNLANTTPNIVHDIVLGGILSATFVPVFVDRLANREPQEAWSAISAVVTVAGVLLAVATVVFWLASPAIIDLYTAASHGPRVAAERAVGTSLLRWFVPQLTCYGFVSIATALLNARRRFSAPMITPVANNLVTIAILVWFGLLVPHPSLAGVEHDHARIVLLGLGTTLGVVVQAALLVPSLRSARLQLRFRWHPGHEAVRAIARLSGWTLGVVFTNQLALVFVLALANGSAAGSVSAYTYAYTFFQLPYGVIAVSIMSAVTPSLSASWSTGDLVAFRRRLDSGLRSMLALVLPAAGGMAVLAAPTAALIIGHGHAAEAGSTGPALFWLSLGLPGFCAFLYLTRVLQSMQDTRSTFFLYVLENGLNIVTAIVLTGPFGVRGLAFSLTFAYTAAAAAAFVMVRRRVGGPARAGSLRPAAHAGAVTVLMVVVVALVSSALEGPGAFTLIVQLAIATLAGVLTYAGAGALAAAAVARHRSLNRPPLRPPPPPLASRPRRSAPGSVVTARPVTARPAPGKRPAGPVHGRLGATKGGWGPRHTVSGPGPRERGEKDHGRPDSG